MIYLVDGLLWVIAIALGLIAASRSRQLFATACGKAWSIACG